MLFHPLKPIQVATSLLMVLILASFYTGSVLATVSPSVQENYNLACTSSLAGQTDQALTYFNHALADGFDDFHYALADTELTNLINTPAFALLLADHQNKLSDLANSRALHLTSYSWGPWQELMTTNTLDQNEAKIRVQWQHQALELEIQLTGKLAASFARPIQPPWSGGPGVMVTLAVPNEASVFESSNTFQFALGLNKSSPVGAIYLGEQLGWQPVRDLNPQFSWSDQRQSALIRASISWQSILPYHPLADSPLGLNLAIRGDNQNEAIHTLFPDPRAFSPQAEFHRYTPVFFDATSETREALVGRLNQSLISDEPLACDLEVISAQSGSGVLTLDFLDHQGHSVLPTGSTQSDIFCQSGLNTITRTADFKALAIGPYLVKAKLELPSGEILSWSSQVLNLGPHWKNNLQDQISEMAPLDQPTTQYYFNTIAQTADKLAVRRHPGQVATTLQMLLSLLKAGKENGSILPETGLMQMVWQDQSGHNQLCSIYLPPGFSQAQSLQPVMLVTEASGTESRLAGRLAQLYEYQDGPVDDAKSINPHFPIYLIPHWDPDNGQTLSQKTDQLAAFYQWTEDYFKFSSLAIAGVDAAAGTALNFCNSHPRKADKLLIFAGARLNPWPEVSQQQLTKNLSGLTSSKINTTWINFTIETRQSGQGKMLLSILKESKYNVPVTEVRGGLSMTQVTDRLVLWVKNNFK